MRFYNFANRDLLAAPYPDAPSISYEIHDGTLSGAVLYNGPHLYVSATHPLTWLMLAPWSGTVRADGVYARFRCDEAPGNVLPIGPGPLQDQWGWSNHRTDHSVIGAIKGGFENPFVWGGCVQDLANKTVPVSYRLLRDGVLVDGKTIDLNQPIYPTLTEGQYRFEMIRSPTINGVATQIETVSTFTASLSTSIDENPPVIRNLHLLGHGLWQEVLDVKAVGQIRFNVDPMPGFDSENSGTIAPPLYTSLADGLTQVSLLQSPDGQVWNAVSLTSLGRGDYLSDQIDCVFRSDLGSHSGGTWAGIPE